MNTLRDALRKREEEANRVSYSKVVDVLCAAADAGAQETNVPATMLDEQVLARIEANGVIIENIPGPWVRMLWGNTRRMGEKVNWTQASTARRTLSMSLREGVIEGIDGHFATVKKKGGGIEKVALARLRLPDRESQIKEFVDALREAHGG